MTFSDFANYFLPVLTVLTICFLASISYRTRGGVLGQTTLIAAIALIFFFLQGLVVDALDPATYPVDFIGDLLQTTGALIFLIGFFILDRSINRKLRG